MLQVALVFLWLVCGLFMADLGLIYMMVLKNYLQHEKQKKGKAEKQETIVVRPYTVLPLFR